MHVIYAKNVARALPLGLQYLRDNGLEEPSRNGPVWVSPVPVTTVYANPKEHVLFSAVRNANPFFHMFEALWMLGGRNDVAFPARYAAQLQLYSDDNATLNGAYGFRWREHFGYDQLDEIIEELKRNPASRRCVLAMWDAMDDYQESMPGIVREFGYEGDLKRAIKGGKDVPCNTHAYFRLNGGQLEMTVCNRSNDVVWGAYGANAVHFGLLQEYVAGRVGARLGRYYQVANNYHIYTEREDVQKLLGGGLGSCPDRYVKPEVGHYTQGVPVPLFASGANGDGPADFPLWHNELEQFLAEPAGKHAYKHTFFMAAQAMAWAHLAYKEGDLDKAMSGVVHARVDWMVAGLEWLARIAAARAAKEKSA